MMSFSLPTQAAFLAIGVALSPVFVGAQAWAQDQASEDKSISTPMTLDLLDRVSLTSSVDGVIKSISAREGEQVSRDQKVVQLDTDRLGKQLAVAQNEYRALRTKSQNDSRIQVSRAQERAAQFNIDKLRDVSRVYNVNVPRLEVVRAESDLRQATAQKIGAQQDMQQFAQEADTKLKEIELLDFDIEKSSIFSSFDGAVSRIDKHVGEFVQRGEVIGELYRLDRLSGVVLISRNDLLPEYAENVEGNLTITSSEGDRSFPIVITRTLPRVDIDGRYRAFVEVENAKTDEGKWSLLPGMIGKATFELNAETSPEQ